MLESAIKPGLAVNAAYKIHEEDVPQFAEIARSLVAVTNSVPGCVYFTVSQDIVDATRFRLSEAWTDKEALGAYSQGEAFQSILAKVMKLRVLDRSGMLLTLSDAQPLEMPTTGHSST